MRNRDNHINIWPPGGRYIELCVFGSRTVPAGPPRDVIRFAVVGGEVSLACDRVILAVGQQGSAPAWLGQHGIDLDEGLVVVDPEGRTAATSIYAGGDCGHGPDLISSAAAAGRRAAVAVCDDHRLSMRGNRGVHPNAHPRTIVESTP